MLAGSMQSIQGQHRRCLEQIHVTCQNRIWKHQERVLSLNTWKRNLSEEKKASFRLLNCIQIEKKTKPVEILMQSYRNVETVC